MKKILSFIFISLCFAGFLSACKKDTQNPFVVFSDKQITMKTVPQTQFKSGTRIYYGVINPDGFDDEVVKVMVFKQDDTKVNYMGYSYYANREYKLKDRRYLLSYFTIYQKGHYILQAFNITNLQKPVVLGEFWVVDK